MRTNERIEFVVGTPSNWVDAFPSNIPQTMGDGLRMPFEYGWYVPYTTPEALLLGPYGMDGFADEIHRIRGGFVRGLEPGQFEDFEPQRHSHDAKTTARIAKPAQRISEQIEREADTQH